MLVSRYLVDDAEIVSVTEMVVAEPRALFPTAEAADLDGFIPRLSPAFHGTDGFVSVIRIWVVRRPGFLCVIDTGAGNGKHRPASPRFDGLDTPFLERMRAAGIVPEAVDLVLCTHLHVDHVGWNTRRVDGKWVATFPRARHVFPAAEVARWLRDKEPSPARHPFEDSVAPLLDRKDTFLSQGDETLAPGLRLVPLPGHSPGMMGVRLGKRALFIADAMHSPVQVWRPDWSSRYCADPAQAARTRHELLDRAAAEDLLLLGAHLGGGGGLRVAARDGGFDFAPEPPDAA